MRWSGRGEVCDSRERRDHREPLGSRGKDELCGGPGLGGFRRWDFGVLLRLLGALLRELCALVGGFLLLRF